MGQGFASFQKAHAASTSIPISGASQPSSSPTISSLSPTPSSSSSSPPISGASQPSQSDGLTTSSSIVPSSTNPSATTAPNSGQTAATTTKDTTPPETTITSVTSDNGNVQNGGLSGQQITINYIGTDASGISHYQCSIDGGLAFYCGTNNQIVLNERPGTSHSFGVAAYDKAGNVDPTPATFRWTVSSDTTQPETSIVSAVDGFGKNLAYGGSTASNGIRISFTGTDASGISYFNCYLDGNQGIPVKCTSPFETKGLSAGKHTFLVQAVDMFGNKDSSLSTFTWTILRDSTPPVVTIDSAVDGNGRIMKPGALTSSNTITFRFTATDNVAIDHVECNAGSGTLDNDCHSPKTYVGLTPGQHTFSIVAYDIFNQVTIARFTWTIDNTPPDTKITSAVDGNGKTIAPGGTTTSTDIKLTLTANDISTTGGSIINKDTSGIAGLQCSLDNAPFAACTSPVSYTGLPFGTHTVQARAVDGAGNIDTTPAIFTWTIDITPPTITASPAGGTFSSAVRVTLSANEPSDIYYSTDGSTPTTSSAKYTGPITIGESSDGTTTLKFFGVDTAGNIQQVQTETYTIDTITPTVSSVNPADGATGVSIDSPGVSVSFSEPVDRSTITTSTFALTNSRTNNAVTGTVALDAAGTTATFTPSQNLAYSTIYKATITTGVKDVAGNALLSEKTWTFTTVADTTPPRIIAAPLGGTFSEPQTVTLSSNEQATIFYTTDGSDPLSSGTRIQYASPISINKGTVTLKFYGVDRADNESPVQTETYVIDTTGPTITASPSGGSYNQPQSVTLSSSDSDLDAIYYTTDGTTNPSKTSGTKYTGAIAISSDTTLKAIAYDKLGNAGDVITETYTFDTTSPTASANPVGGIYNSAQSVTLTANEPATIYYTIDGSDPTATPNNKYSTPISITSTTTLKFMAVDTAGNTGDIYIQTYTIDTSSPAVRTVSPSDGARAVAIDSPGISASFSEPVDRSTVTTSSFTLTDTTNNNAVSGTVALDTASTTATFTPSQNLAYSTTYKATITTGVKDVAGNALSSEKTWTFSTGPAPDTTAPTVTADPKGGSYDKEQSIKLTSQDSDLATIYYTIDGSDPTTRSNIYSTPIAISTTTTLKFFGVDAAGNQGQTQTETYTITTGNPGTSPPPVPTNLAYTGGNAATHDVTVTGDAQPGSKIQLYASGGAAIGNPVTADATTGKWSITLSSLADGQSYTITAKAIDPNDSTKISADSTAITLTVYYSLPLLTSTNPASGQQIASTARPTITATFNHKMDPSTINDQTFVIAFGYNGQPFWPATVSLSADGMTAILTPTKPLPIPLVVHVQVLPSAKDAAGNSLSTSSPVPNPWLFFIQQSQETDTTPPTVTASPKGGTFFSSTQVTLTANEESDIFYTTDGISEPSFTGGILYTGPITISKTGTTTLKFFARDVAGNQGQTQTETYTISSTQPPTQPPSPPVITQPADGTAFIAPPRTDGLIVSVVGTAQVGTTINVYDGSTLVDTVTTRADGTWVSNILLHGGNLQPITHTITATATDAPNNTSGPSNSVTVTVRILQN